MKPVTDWEERYQNDSTGWDLGSISTPLKVYFDQLENRSIKILIPGGGNSYEAEYLYNAGFHNVYVIDIAPSPLRNLLSRIPDFPQENLIEGNFFQHKAQYDLIVEQTFFCAINRKDRATYAQQVHRLLKPKGKLMGLLWAGPMDPPDKLPYGGNKEEYQTYFDPYFNYLHFEMAYNSIAPRKNSELFLLAQKK